jgi:hypothetical protein
MSTQVYVKALPENAIPCNGPLMYDMNRHITPDGQLFHVHATTKRIKKINISKQKQWSWGNAQRLLPDGTSIDMESIDGFYAASNGRVTPAALMAYYFIEKINPIGMRVINIHPDNKLHIDYLQWGTRQEQDTIRLNQIRSLVNPDNIYQNVNDVNLDEYTEWNSSNYYIKNDGTDVVTITTTDKIRRVSIIIGNDGYHSVTLHINGIKQVIRMNRLMAAIHHGLNINNPLMVVDHKNRDITNNRPDNLEITTIQENTRRGDSSCEIIKVDPSTMIILEEIRCIREYSDNNPEYSHKTIYRVKNTGEPYNGFIWLDKSLEGKVFTHDNGVIKLTNWSIDNTLEYVRAKIYELIRSQIITENIIPLNDNGSIVFTNELNNIIETLDPRGVADSELAYETRNHMNEHINGHLPCCKIISIHGKNSANAQLVLCVKTMIVFTRSRDNLNMSIRKCPLCNRTSDATRQRFNFDDPEMSIPVYSYHPAAGNQAKDSPLAFQAEYLNVLSGINSDGTQYKPSKLELIRQSLFGLANESTKSWIKQANGFPKRKVYKGLYWSFHPPINDKLDERHPNWILNRRLNCAVMVQLRAAVIARGIN